MKKQRDFFQLPRRVGVSPARFAQVKANCHAELTAMPNCFRKTYRVETSHKIEPTQQSTSPRWHNGTMARWHDGTGNLGCGMDGLLLVERFVCCLRFFLQLLTGTLLDRRVIGGVARIKGEECIGITQ